MSPPLESNPVLQSQPRALESLPLSARRVSVLGATGSVGRSTLDLIAQVRAREGDDACPVVALTANQDVAGLAEAARQFRAEVAVIADPTRGEALKDALAGSGVEALAGPQALCDAAARPADWVMAAIVGAAGLAPTLAAVQTGAAVALANKEALICAGPVLLQAAKAAGARLLPVDSEHNAIFQVLDQVHPERVARLILTASGGPFRTATRAQMAAATPEQAVAHPVWSMGAKISVDSATLMNKGLELIEAWRLFAVRPDQLAAVIHPQSIIHSMVEYVDGSVLAQLGPPDMAVPIAHTLAWPDRMDHAAARLDLAAVGALTFEKPDEERFAALRLAKRAMQIDGMAPAILNAANEVAVARFLDRKIGFLDIPAVVEEVLDRAVDAGQAMGSVSTLEQVLAVDAAARRQAEAVCMARAS